MVDLLRDALESFPETLTPGTVFAGWLHCLRALLQGTVRRQLINDDAFRVGSIVVPFAVKLSRRVIRTVAIRAFVFHRRGSITLTRFGPSDPVPASAGQGQRRGPCVYDQVRYAVTLRQQSLQ
jgi:hypothetical protein